MKNIILDVGGILFDDSKENINQLLNKDADEIYKIAYGKEFSQCLLGNNSIDQYINSLSNNPYYKELEYILRKDNLKLSYPLLTKNLEYIKSLKRKGYKLYLLTNITEESYNYINSILNIENIFEGGIYSYKEHIIKPNADIYKLIIKRYNLDLKETIFFDDNQKNIDSAIQEGINSIKFNSISDIQKALFL